MNAPVWDAESAPDHPRGCLLLDGAWAFRRGRPDRRWLRGGGLDGEAVGVPHCWNQLDTFQPGKPYYRGVGAYRTRFRWDPSGDGTQAWLCSEGFYGIGDVWIDGRRVGHVDGQYIGFRLPVGAYLRPGGEHTVAIRLSNRCGCKTLPGIAAPDFLLYGGLAGRVWLEWAGLVCLDDARTDITAVAGDVPCVQAAVQTVNAGTQAVKARVAWTVRARDGRVVQSSVAPDSVVVGAGERVTLRATIPASGVALWSLEAPCLYGVEADLYVDDRLVDRAVRRVGFRSAEFRPDRGFFLNDRHVFLRGCNRHESMPGLGHALPEALHRADVRQIRAMGLNFVRLSHYPQSPAFLDACDELGVLVYAELASWKRVRRGRWLRMAELQFDALLRRDRHHPSVIVWGMGNEGRDRTVYRRLRDVASREDSARPVAYAENHLYRARRRRTLGIPDVWGCNYELHELEAGRDAARLRCVLVTECSNAPHTARGNLAAERGQIEQLKADLDRIEAFPFVAGFAFWSFCDYATMRKRRFVRHCGVVDAWREPKAAAYWLKARYGKTPFLALAADGSGAVGGGGGERRVDVFSGVEEADLFVNGEPLCRLHGRGHHVVAAPFAFGRLEAVDASGSGVTAVLDAFGPAQHLKLSCEYRGRKEGMVRLEVLDASGRRVRDWQGSVRVSAHGDAAVYPYSALGVWVAGGVARVPVAFPPASGQGGWLAETDGLRGAELSAACMAEHAERGV